MHLHLTWINVVILFGGLQGLAFSLILLFNRKHPGAKYLSFFIFVLAYNSLETFNWSSTLNLKWFDVFSYVFIFALGPSLYLYIRTLVYPDTAFTRKTLLSYYSLFIFQFLIRSGFGLYKSVTAALLIKPFIAVGTVEYWHLFLSELLSVLVFLFFLVKSYTIHKQYFTSTSFRHTEYNAMIRSWIKTLLVVMTALAILWPLTVAVPFLFEIPYNAHYYPIEIVLVFVIYWIALTGYHRTQIIYRKQNASPIPDADIIIQKIRDAISLQKLFLDPELSIVKLSDTIATPVKTVSAVINQTTGSSFNEFVNRYRIDEFKSRMQSGASSHLTLSGLALECGFNSQATFQRAFKQITGMTPSEYQSRIKKNP